jgi:hypothetical protein
VRPATLPAADAERLLGKALEHEYPWPTCCAAPAWASTPWPKLARIARPARRCFT